MSWVMDHNPFKVDDNHHTTCLMDKVSGTKVVRSDDMSISQYDREHYSVTKEEYDLDYYPTYCMGSCTLLSGSTVQTVYETAKVTNPGKFLIEVWGQFQQVFIFLDKNFLYSIL